MRNDQSKCTEGNLRSIIKYKFTLLLIVFPNSTVGRVSFEINMNGLRCLYSLHSRQDRGRGVNFVKLRNEGFTVQLVLLKFSLQLDVKNITRISFITTVIFVVIESLNTVDNWVQT